MGKTWRLRGPRVSRIQQEILIDFMERHPRLVIGKLDQHFTSEMRNDLWQQLTDLLNIDGARQKNVAKWKKCWRSWRFEVRSKTAGTGFYRKRMCGGMGVTVAFTPLEQRMLKIIQEATIARKDWENTCDTGDDFNTSNIVTMSEDMPSGGADELLIPKEEPNSLSNIDCTIDSENIVGNFQTTFQNHESLIRPSRSSNNRHDLSNQSGLPQSPLSADSGFQEQFFVESICEPSQNLVIGEPMSLKSVIPTSHQQELRTNNTEYICSSAVVKNQGNTHFNPPEYVELQSEDDVLIYPDIEEQQLSTRTQSRKIDLPATDSEKQLSVLRKCNTSLTISKISQSKSSVTRLFTSADSNSTSLQSATKRTQFMPSMVSNLQQSLVNHNCNLGDQTLEIEAVATISPEILAIPSTLCDSEVVEQRSINAPVSASLSTYLPVDKIPVLAGNVVIATVPEIIHEHTGRVDFDKDSMKKVTWHRPITASSPITKDSRVPSVVETSTVDNNVAALASIAETLGGIREGMDRMASAFEKSNQTIGEALLRIAKSFESFLQRQ